MKSRVFLTAAVTNISGGSALGSVGTNVPVLQATLTLTSMRHISGIEKMWTHWCVASESSWFGMMRLRRGFVQGFVDNGTLPHRHPRSRAEPFGVSHPHPRR